MSRITRRYGDEHRARLTHSNQERRQQIGRGAGTLRPAVNAAAARVPNRARLAAGLPRAGFGLGVVASYAGVSDFRRASRPERAATAATVASTAAQGGKLVADRVVRGSNRLWAVARAASRFGRFGTPGFTAIAQGITGAAELSRRQYFNGSTSLAIGAGAALLVVPGAQPVGVALIAGGAALKVGRWAWDALF